MAGRHREITGDPPPRFPAGVLAAFVALAVLVAVGGWVLLDAGADGCEGGAPLNVYASPDIAPVASGVAARFNKSAARIDGKCFDVRVSAHESWKVAGVLAGKESAEVDPGPDVWIADSSIWVDYARANAVDAARIPKTYESVASSPTVIAMTAPVASQISGSGRVGWKRLLQEMNSAQPIKIGFPDPTRNTTGLATMAAAAKIIGDKPEARAKQVALTRALSNNAADQMADLFEKLPQTQDAATIASSVAALPATEQSVWKYNVDKPSVPLVALYPSEGALDLDYPYVVTLRVPDAKRQKAAERFLAEMKAPEARGDLQTNGFRTPDGQAGRSLGSTVGAEGQQPKNTKKPSARTVSALISSWRALSLPTRMLVLIDVSGSMNSKVPGVGKTRLEVTVSAAQQGLGLFGDTTDMGLWAFSAQLVGRRDYRELVSTGPLSQPFGDTIRRGAIANALTQLKVKKGGSTGLYDSILAAYRTARTGYRPDKVNSVLVFTDGRNEDPGGGVSLDALLAEMKKGLDPQRPLPVFIIGFGPDTDMVAANKIAAASKGAAYRVNSAEEINKVFLDAVGQRTCRPSC